MKKIIFLLIILLTTGCEYNKTSTIIESNNECVISVNFPITNIKNIDKKIKKDIDNIYSNFKKECVKDSELNIDYNYYKNNNYISITLKIYIYHYEKQEYIITYFYNIKNNEFLSLNDIIQNYSNIYFSIDNNYLYLYTNYPNYYTKEKYLLDDLDLKIKLEKIEEPTVKYLPSKNRVLNPDDKYVALTFDDGPSIYTANLLKILKDNDINATFFILGNKVEMYQDIINESIKNGNEIGNHSYNHKWLIKLSNEEIKEQIDNTQDIIKKYTGYTPQVFRPTYGSVNNYIRNFKNLDVVLWNIDTLDWKYKSVNKIVSNATKKVKDGDIILMHELYQRSINAVKQIIPILKDKGFKFVTISELREIQKLRKYEINRS